MWRGTVEPPELDDPYLAPLLECLVRIDLVWLKRNPKAPSLYASGVRYRREPKGRELWASVPFVLSRGYGDCEDLACWRVAELQILGENARAVFTRKALRGGYLYHIIVRRGDGRIEDPSKLLGMGGGR